MADGMPVKTELQNQIHIVACRFAAGFLVALPMANAEDGVRETANPKPTTLPAEVHFEQVGSTLNRHVKTSIPSFVLTDFSHDGTIVASHKTSESGIYLDRVTQLGLSSLRELKSSSHLGEIKLSPDNSAIGVCSRSWVDVLDATTAKEEFSGSGPIGNLSEMTFSPDSSLIAACCPSSCEVYVWDIKSSEKKRWQLMANGHIKFGCDDLRFSRDGLHVIVVGRDANSDKYRVRFFDHRKKGEARFYDLASKHGIFRVYLPSEGDWIFTKGSKGCVIHDLQDGKARVSLEGDDIGDVAAISPDGKIIATPRTSGGVVIWDAKTGSKIDSFGAPGVDFGQLWFAQVKEAPESYFLVMRCS